MLRNQWGEGESLWFITHNMIVLQYHSVKLITGKGLGLNTKYAQKLIMQYVNNPMVSWTKNFSLSLSWTDIVLFLSWLNDLFWWSVYSIFVIKYELAIGT